MKKLLMLSLALAASMFAVPAKADVDIRIGAGVPGVVIGSTRDHHHRDYHPPVRHRHYAPPLRHRHYAPPVYYYPEKVYRHPHKHYRGKHYRPDRHMSRSMHRHHLRHGTRPFPPPHARAHGHWSR